MKREFLDYIEDIIEAMEDGLSFIADMKYDDFVRNKKTIYAVVRTIEIIGEAVKRVPNSVRGRYPMIPWKDMAGMGNKMIHEYFGVDLKRVWKTVKEDITNLKPSFDKILKDFEQ